MHKIFYSRLTFLALLLLGSLSIINAQTINGKAWNDLNNNGLQDSGEMGLGSVWVQVVNATTNASISGAQGFTAMSGTYSFSVPAGQYKVKIANPGNGFNAATPNVGSNDNIDSDIAIATSYSAVFTIAAGQTVSIDGGFTTGGQCYTPVTATTSNVTCNGSTFSFAITASGGTSFGGNSWGWDYTAGGISMQPYGQAKVVGPFPCGSPATVTIKDHDNPFCTATVTVSAPACCGGGPTPPTVSISDVTVNESAGTASLTVSLSAPSATPTTVTVTTSNGSATSGSDYTSVTTTVTIPAGATSTTVTFPIINDNIAEPTELFNATLSNPNGATIADGSGTVTILDNDDPTGDPCAGITINSGANNTIVVGGITAQFSKIKITNSSGVIVYNPTFTSAPAGGTNTSPSLAPGTYTVKVTFLNANLTAICFKELTITVGGTPTPPSLTINDITVNENAGTATLQICASQTSTSPITVQYSTSNGTALSGSDYSSTTMVATIAAGQTCTTVTVPIINDNTNEPTENFNVNLSNPSGATIADNQGKVTILDDDATTQPPTVSISDITVNESAGTASLTVSLSAPSATPTTVTVTTSNGSATSGADYTPVTTTVTIPAGATNAIVSFPIVDDNTAEPTELFNATLSNPNGATIADGNGTVTILDNDGTGDPCVNITINPGANNTVVVGGLTSQFSKIKITNSSGVIVYNPTFTNAPAGGTNTSPSLAPGTYTVKVTILTANLTAVCSKEITVTVGGNSCNINIIVTNKICNNNNTPSNPNDDTYTFVFTVTGTGTSNTWQGGYDNAYLGAFAFGPTAYNTPITLGPFPAGPFSPGNVFPPIIVNGADINLYVEDSQISNCTKSITVLSTGACSSTQTPPTVSISDVTVNENAGTASLIVSLSAPSTTPTTVTVTSSNGSAVSGADYTPVTTTVTIPAGFTSAVVTFPLIDDTTGEPTELFNATLSNPIGATIADGSGTVTILDNDSNQTPPTVSITDVTVNENAGTASLTVLLSATSTTPTTVTVTTSNGSATSGPDYVPVTTTVTIPAGSLGTVVTFPIVDDNTAEPTEFFNATLSNPSGASIADGSGRVTILDNDAPVATPIVSISDVTVNENAGTASLTVSLTTPSSTPTTVTVITSNGTATSGTDYTPVTTTVTIPAGATSATVTFPIVDDNIAETTETFNATLINPNGAIIGDGSGVVTILDNDSPQTTPTVSISDITVNENAGTASLTVSLSAPSTTPTTVTVTSSNGSAVSGADYTPVTTTVTIPAGATSATVTFPIVDDNTAETTELFNATLSNPNGATIADGNGTVTILDNDPPQTPPTVSISDVTVNENAGTASLIVSISAPSATPTTVTVTSSNGSAVSGADYTPVTTTVTIPAGFTSAVVTFPLIDDTTGEPTELFNATLSNPIGATIADGSGTVTILDNDSNQTPPTVSITDVTVNENAGTASLTVLLSATSTTPTTVTVTTSNGSATSGPDYVPVTTTVTIPAGSLGTIVTFPIVDDNTAEPTEAFNATLSNPSGATIADGSGTVTILDNDAPVATPIVSISDVTVNENAGTASLTVSLTTPSSTPTTVTVITSNGTATSGTDYTPVTTTVTIPAGATSATVTFPIVDDNIAETTETFNATLINPNGAIIGDGSGVVTILDNDSPQTTPTVSISDITVNENAGTASLTVSLSAPSTTPTTVTVTSSNGSAVSGADYTPVTTTVTIPAGATSATVTFPIVDDNTAETTELFNATLSNPNGATIADGNGTVTILDNDPPQTPPTVSISDVTVNENAGTASLIVSISAPSATPTTVTVTSSNGSAVSGADYTPVTTTVTIPAGFTSAVVTFPLIDDTTGEPTELFNATLSNPIGATIADGSGTVTILDNDSNQTPPTVSITDVTVNENAGTASLTVLLSATSTTPTTVTVTTSNGSATSGPDYVPVTTTVTIPAGSLGTIVTFPIVDDNTAEPTEAFNATLSNPSGATIADGSGTVTILDNDAPVATPIVSISDVTVNENAGTASLTVSLTTPSSTPTTVTLITSNGTATSGTDYTPVTTTVTIPAGATSATVTFPIIDDNIAETTETFNATLINPNGAIVGDGSGIVTILDNDSPQSTAPVANPDVTTTPQNTPVTISTLVNDNLNGGTLQMLMLVSNPSNGTAVLNGTNFVYTPNAGFSGTDVFTYKIVASNGTSNTTTVTITVPQPQTPPVANPDVTTTPQNTPVTISTLINDNLNGGTLQMLMLVSNPSNGTAVLNGTNFVYTPNAGFSGTDVFTYKIVASNGTSNTTTVTITVPQPQTPPVANNDVTTTPQNTAVTISQLTNDNLNGGTLQMLMLVSNPSNGTAVLNGTNFVYTPNAGFSGIDVFTYKIVASNGTSNTATITITVPQPITPPVAVNDNTSTQVNTSVTITQLTNDSLKGGTLQMVMLVSNPSNGTVVLNGLTYVYTPNTGFTGNDQFTYKLVASNGTSNIATVSIVVSSCSIVFVGCPANISVIAACGTTSATATWTAPTATSTCGSPVITTNKQPGTSFNVGTTTVIYTATINGQSVTCQFVVTVTASSSVPNNRLVFYNFNSCFSNSNTSGSATDYSEFGAITYGFTAGKIFKNDNTMHSCNPGVNATLAICTQSGPGCTPNYNKALAFNASASTAGSLTQIRFNVKSANPSPIFNGTAMPNNRLTKMAVRISSGGTVVYEDISTNVTATGTQITLNLPNISYTSGTSYKVELVGYCPATTNLANYIYDIDELELIGSICGTLPPVPTCSAYSINATGTCSSSTGTPTNYYVHNKSLTPVRIFSKSSSGTETFVQQVPGGGSYTVATAIGNYWVIRKVDGTHLKTWKVTACNQIVSVSCTTNSISNSAALTFNASRQESAAELKWLSNSGDVNDVFFVEHSLNGDEWTDIFAVDGRGAAGELLQFNQVDNNAAKGDNFYRIRQVFQDGSINHSQVEKVFIPNATAFGLYPNPAAEEVFVETAAFEGQAVTILVHSQLGKVLKSVEVPEATDVVRITLDGLESGFYTVTVISKGVQRTNKLVISKSY